MSDSLKPGDLRALKNDEFNIELNLNLNDSLMKLTVAHEVAHIGEYLLESKMRHRKTWKEIYERLKE